MHLPRIAGLLATAALAAVLALPVAGCKTTGGDITGSLGAPSEPRTEAEWRRAADYWGGRYQSDPSDPVVAMKYAQALRATDRKAQAAAVLEQASIKHPHDKALLGDFGRALADVGKLDQALDVLGRAHTPDQPDWRILNAQGAVLDQLGRSQDARRHYSSALKIKPNEPSVLSNLGLSYALTKDLRQAESMLRRAAAQPGAEPRVRQNLGLVVALQGRFDEAEQIVRADLPAAEAAAAVDDLRRMIDERGGVQRSTQRGSKKKKSGS
ncbi:MAG: tetratricopeptide repeat protein [Pseudolabrys sp.]